MSVLPKEVKFAVGTRVYVPELDVVGTVREVVDASHKVEWLLRGSLKSSWFRGAELIEQPELPWGDTIFE